MAKKSDIPFGAQFSPNQVNLPELLLLIDDKAGDRTKMTEAIRDKFFVKHTKNQQLKLADNTVLGLRSYGLLDEDGATPTQLANDLLAVASTPEELYEQFAKHILVHLKGIAFVETVQMMQTAGESITLQT